MHQWQAAFALTSKCCPLMGDLYVLYGFMHWLCLCHVVFSWADLNIYSSQIRHQQLTKETTP